MKVFKLLATSKLGFPGGFTESKLPLLAAWWANESETRAEQGRD